MLNATFETAKTDPVSSTLNTTFDVVESPETDSTDSDTTKVTKVKRRKLQSNNSVYFGSPV